MEATTWRPEGAVPELVGVQENWVLWEVEKFVPRRASRMLDRFVRIRTEKDVLRVAKQWGPLGLCRHGYTRYGVGAWLFELASSGEVNIPEDEDTVGGWWWACCPVPLVRREGRRLLVGEPVEAWIWHAEWLSALVECYGYVECGWSVKHGLWKRVISGPLPLRGPVQAVATPTELGLSAGVERAVLAGTEKEVEVRVVQPLRGATWWQHEFRGVPPGRYGRYFPPPFRWLKPPPRNAPREERLRYTVDLWSQPVLEWERAAEACVRDLDGFPEHRAMVGVVGLTAWAARHKLGGLVYRSGPVLARELVDLVRSRVPTTSCSYCGRLYVPRRTVPGQAHYCQACREKGVPELVRARRYRARLRQQRGRKTP